MTSALAEIRQSIRPIRREVAETLSPRGGTADEALPLLMILLTMVTGIVDALAYLGLGPCSSRT
jgi:hypothetical protein